MGLTRNHSVKWVFILSLPFVIFLFSRSPAYGQWTSVTSPYVSANWDLSGVHFTSANEGWAVGSRGTNQGGAALLHYQNGTWTSVTPPLDSGSLRVVHFTSENEGWAVGGRCDSPFDCTGVLLHYQNGDWTSVTPPPVSENWSLWGVHFTSANEGWAVGQDSLNSRVVLLHYQNGDWTSVTSPLVIGYLLGVHFTSADEGWAVGGESQYNQGILLHYQNGNWTSVTPPTVSWAWHPWGIHFTSANEGWAVGQDGANARGLLLHYQNGTWTPLTPPSLSGNWWLLGVHFTSENEGWAVGYNLTNFTGVLLHYQNGDWTSVTPPPVGPHWHLSGVHFTSANEGWAVGPDFSTSTGVLLSYHGVTNVTLVSPNGGEPVPAGELYPVSWEAPAAATKFKLQYSMDNGITWKPMVQGLVPGRSYGWQVPVPANNKRRCLVKITGYNENSVRIGSDISDAPFTIEVLKLDAPNGGEPLISKAQFPITWTTNPNVPSVHHVQLSYTLNNGVTWKAINTTGDPSDDGNFLWTVPNVTMERKKCKVKIVLKSTSGKTLGSDISDDPFTIRPAP